MLGGAKNSSINYPSTFIQKLVYTAELEPSSLVATWREGGGVR